MSIRWWIYGLLLLALTLLCGVNTTSVPKPDWTASRELPLNTRLEASDLIPPRAGFPVGGWDLPAASAFVGKYVVKKIPKGQAVALEAVAPAPAITLAEGRVLLSFPATHLEGLGALLNAGAEVYIASDPSQARYAVAAVGGKSNAFFVMIEVERAQGEILRKLEKPPELRLGKPAASPSEHL